MKRLICMLCAGLLSSAVVYAQQGGNPGGLSPDTPGLETGNPAADHSNAQDKLFVRQAAIGNQAEVELGQLARKKAASQPVRDFAQHMVDDHGKSGELLRKLGRGANPNIPKDLDPEHQSVRAKLERASGKDFDIAYLGSMIQDHQRTANLLQWEIGNGQSEPLKKYARDTLPDVMEHLEMAKQQYAMLTSGSSAGTPPEK
jgi:putative membrane protein